MLECSYKSKGVIMAENDQPIELTEVTKWAEMALRVISDRRKSNYTFQAGNDCWMGLEDVLKPDFAQKFESDIAGAQDDVVKLVVDLYRDATKALDRADKFKKALADGTTERPDGMTEIHDNTISLSELLCAYDVAAFLAGAVLIDRRNKFWKEVNDTYVHWDNEQWDELCKLFLDVHSVISRKQNSLAQYQFGELFMTPEEKEAARAKDAEWQKKQEAANAALADYAKKDEERLARYKAEDKTTEEHPSADTKSENEQTS
jgi:hypothetical protein